MIGIDSKTLRRLREEYPKGCCAWLARMEDPYTKLRPGDTGTVIYVDDVGTIHAAWDCGRCSVFYWEGAYMQGLFSTF